jgi:hypothetical protein
MSNKKLSTITPQLYNRFKSKDAKLPPTQLSEKIPEYKPLEMKNIQKLTTYNIIDKTTELHETIEMNLNEMLLINTSTTEKSLTITLPKGAKDSCVRIKDIASANKVFCVNSCDMLEIEPGVLIEPSIMPTTDKNYRNYEWIFYDGKWLLMNRF